MNLQVKKCIINNCNNDAYTFTGHLHNNKQIIDAGFCKEHGYRIKNKSSWYTIFYPKLHIKPICKSSNGCFGKWIKKYGKERYSL